MQTERGAIPVTLDRPRILFFDMPATFKLAEKYGTHIMPALYTVDKGVVRLKSPELLSDLVLIGLQAEARENGEDLTAEATVGFIRPWNFADVFNAVVLALTGATVTPALPGKTEADAKAGTVDAPKDPAKSPMASTTSRRKGSRSGSSA